MSLLAGYLRSRLKAFILYASVTALFVIADLLFDTPSIVILYPLALSIITGMIIMAVDLALYVRRHRRLLHEDMPSAIGAIEKDYQEMITALKEEADISRRKASSDYNNMIEYYTIWAHQIKTPISSMRLNLQSEDSETARKLMGDLNRIEAYVEMVLTFLRLDSDSTDYLLKEYDLDEIIRPAARKFSREFILKKLSLEYQPTGYKTVTDSKWLSFIIEQVISNAVKYTSEGKVSIRMEQPGILLIEDTGIGISAEDLPRIFENGYTGFNGREDKRASGIGLYLCKRIADNLGHRITAESTLGEGTKMMIDLRNRTVVTE